MAGARYDLHNGKKFLYMDFSYSKFDEILEAIKQSAGLIAAEPAGSVLGLVDVRKSVFNRDVAQALRDFAACNEPFMKSTVVVGTDGIKAVILSAVIASTQRKNIIAMDDVEKARDFLTSQ